MDDWRVLGFEGPVSRELVRAAYCKLALAHHPDRGGDTAYFQRIAEAYHNVASISDEESGKEDSTDPPSPTWIADVPITALFARSWPTCDPTTRHRFRVRFCTETHTWQPPNCVVRVMSGPWSWPSEPYAKWRFEEKGASVPTLYLEMDSNNDDDHDDTQIITSPNGECVALVVPGVITDPCCTYRGVCPNTNLPWIVRWQHAQKVTQKGWERATTWVYLVETQN